MEAPEAFRTQAEACARLGSPMYAALLARLAEDIEAGGPTARLLRGHEHDPGPSALALRLAGSLHRLVLAGEAPRLAEHYPSAGGTWDPEAAWPAYVATAEEHADRLRHLLEQPPQTNEVGRGAALVGGLLLLDQRFGLPVRLLEVGASAGLNLRADHHRYTDARGRSWGDPDSPVVVEDAWHGDALPLDRSVRVVERAGCDVAPLDPGSAGDRLTLAAYVWPDQERRRQRLLGALEVARRVPAPVHRLDAASFVEGVDPAPGALTVLWHSVMWQYLPAAQQQRVTARLEDLGSRADEQAPLAHLYAEPVRRTPGSEHEFLVCLRSWPGPGETEVLGGLAPHGVPVTWRLPAGHRGA